MSDERARLFVALEVSAEARAALERWRSASLLSASNLRPVPTDALHATLCFLGWRSVGEIDQIGDACAAAIGGLAVPSVALGRPVWLPARRPRVLAVELDDASGALAAVQDALSTALSGGGWYAPESRPFFAHVTVARVPGRMRMRPVEVAAPEQVAFDACNVTLYRSHLGRGGSRYEALRTMELRASAPARDPVAVVRGFHVAQGRAYAGGDLSELRDWLTEDAVWHVPGRSAVAGDHRGVEAVLSYFERRRAMTDETFRIQVHGVQLIGDRIVQLAGGTAVRDGSPVRWETVGVFRVSDGRIAECWLVPFDLYEFDEIWRS